jgi:hypothetical protein
MPMRQINSAVILISSEAEYHNQSDLILILFLHHKRTLMNWVLRCLLCLCLTNVLFTLVCYLCLLCCFCCWLIYSCPITLMNKNWKDSYYWKHFNRPEQVTGPDDCRLRRRRLQSWNKSLLQIILTKLPVNAAPQRNPLRLLWFCRKFPRFLEEKFEEDCLAELK